MVETDLRFVIHMSDVNFSMVKGLQRTQQTDQKLLYEKHFYRVV